VLLFHRYVCRQVVERLQAWQAALPSPCQVVLLPAVRDAFHHPTFPQPAIELQAQDQVRPAAAVSVRICQSTLHFTHASLVIQADNCILRIAKCADNRC
jgi:hypothetical protein